MTDFNALLASFPKTRHCGHCTHPFTATQIRDIYCSEACQLAWHEANVERKPGRAVSALASHAAQKRNKEKHARQRLTAREE